MNYCVLRRKTGAIPRLVAVVALGFLSGLLVGCGREGLERVIVGGRVTYLGQPLKEGEIRLVPVKGAKLPSSAGYIVDGQYTIDANGGVPVGAYKVQIEAYRDISPTAGPKAAQRDSDIPPSRKQYIPRKYNADSMLELDIPPGSGRMTKDLQLTD